MPLDEQAKATLKAKLGEIKGLVKADDDWKDVAAGIQSEIQPAYQIPFRAGLSKGKDEGGADVTTVKTELEQTRTKLTETETKLKELEGKTPDVAAVRAELEGQIQRLKDEHKRREQTLQQLHERERLNTAREIVKADMIAKGVKPIAAEYAVNLPSFEKGLRHEAGKDGADGRWQVLGEDGVPEQLDAKVNPLSHYAEKLAAGIDADLKTMAGERGSDTGRSKGHANGGESRGTKWDSIRDKKREEQENAADRPDLSERLGRGGQRSRGARAGARE